jgi:hypothetical protein
VLDGNNAAARSSGRVLQINGSYTWFWGFEVMSSESAPPVESSGPTFPKAS